MTPNQLIDRLLEELGPENSDRLLRPLVQRIAEATLALLIDAELLDRRRCPHCAAVLVAIASIDGPLARRCAECHEDVVSEVFPLRGVATEGT